MKAPFFSIVIPVYNAEQHIEETITSVLRQKNSDWELIVVNDGSTDHSMERISILQDKRMRIVSIPNSGVSCARNIGIREARGKYIAFLDSDDVWDSDHLTRAHLYLSQHEDIAWYSSRYVMGADTECLSLTAAPTPIEEQPYFATPSLYVHSSTSILKADNAKALLPLFPENMKNAEDWAAWSKYAIHHPLIAFTETQDVLYRQHAGSVTADSDEDNLSRLYFALPNYWLKQHRIGSASEAQQLYYRYRTTQRWQLRISKMPIKQWNINLARQRRLLGFARHAIIFSMLKTIDLLVLILNKLLYIGSSRDERAIMRKHHQEIV